MTWWDDFVKPFVLPLLGFGAIAMGLVVLIFGLLWTDAPEWAGGVTGIVLGLTAVVAANLVRIRSI